MEPQTRRMNLKLTVDIWDWSAGNRKGNPVDITNAVKSYRFQKSIKNPSGSCQLEMLPQASSINLLSEFSTMDVLKIYEFGTLKFVGFIRRISYSGTIERDGKPNRSGVLTVSHMGALLYEAKTGLGIGVAIGRPDDELFTYSKDLFKAISDATLDGTSYKELVEAVVDSMKTYVENLGGTAFINYLEEYLSVGDGLESTESSATPRDFRMYTGMEQSIGFWDIVSQLVEKPFAEFFVDNGPRKISLNGKEVNLNEKSHLIFRNTPFDGWVNAWSDKAFQEMEAVYIDEDHLTKFNLAIGMDEMYTTYTVKYATHQFSELPRMLLGQFAVDKPQLGKYLFRPLIIEQYYTRQEKLDSVDVEEATNTFDTSSKDLADTLKNWYTHNDEYMSGTISFLIPADESKDVRIGDKVEAYGIEGSFYVEGIAHTWQYKGALMCDLSVTRGFNNTKKIDLSNKIFKRNVIQ